jgi:cell division protein FtsN
MSTSDISHHNQTRSAMMLDSVQNRRKEKASIIMEMAGELCISQEKLRRIDKATIVKLAIDYIRAHGLLCDSAPVEPSLCSQTKQLKNSHNNNIDEQRHRELNNQQQQQRHQDKPQQIMQQQLLERHLQQQQQQQQQAHDYDDNEELDDQQQPQQLEQQQVSGTPQSEHDTRTQQEQELKPEHHQHQQQRQPLYSAPKLATASIFAPKTIENMNPHFLMIEKEDNGKGAFVLKPDTEILDEDDLTHLAPQAGDISISLEVEPLEGIPLEDLLIPSPPAIAAVQQQWWTR